MQNSVEEQNGRPIAPVCDDRAISGVCFINRRAATHAGIPEAFMPSATEFAVTDGVTIAFLAHPWGIYGAKKLSSWCRAWNERGRIFETAMFDAPAYMLLLRDYGSRRGEYRQLLSIERFPFGQPNDREVLTLNSSPIFFTNLRTAKAIAKLCHPQPRQEAQALHWMRITGEDHSVQ